MRVHASAPSTPQALLEQFLSELENIHKAVVGASCRVAQLPSEWRSGLRRLEPPTTSEVTVVAAILQRANDDSIAVVDGGQQTSYRQLNTWSARIAGALKYRGVGPGSRVAVNLPRSAELIAVLLGILRSGASYVPIDPAWPDERISYVIEDCSPELLVSENGSSHGTVDTARAADLAAFESAGELQPADLSAPLDPAYVIYTSGSTGRPKGVEIPHTNIANLVTATAGLFALGPGDTWTFFHSTAFDYSVWEVWACLATGGRLVVVPYLTARSPETFRDLLRSEAVTIASQTPPAFAQLVETVTVTCYPSELRLVILGGAPVEPAAVRRWYDVVPEQECQVVNMYGITETTVHSTVKTLSRYELARSPRSVGTPLSGWGLDVRDAEGRPLPPLVRGEICVSGAGLASGYVNNPELTQDRFTTDARSGVRYYRSGDLGRILPNGELEHLGRIDRQVKIRGYRIELDEIRASLMEHPAVRDAEVITRAATSGDPHDLRLEAFCACNPQDVTPRELRSYVTRRLPTYMVPDRIEVLGTLPLTENGKTDSKALQRLLESPGHAAPRPPAGIKGMAAVVAEIWGEMFDSPVAENSDFFDLGGNSLLAIATSKRLKERGLPALPVHELYSAPTVNGVASYLEARQGSKA
nr:non-ribosomal peptide synthetase [Rhodococcus sp. HNM0563]